MSRKTTGLSKDLAHWIQAKTLREPEILESLRKAMEDHADGSMQTAAEQAQFMQLLMRAIDARQAIEIGVFTGYSAIAIASALPADGRLVACDISPEYLNEAAKWWGKAGLSDRIETRLGPAVESLDALIAEGAAGTFDFVYADADKESSLEYYERSMVLLRPGGLFTIDNMLRGGRVADPNDDDPSIVATREVAEKLRCDARVDWSLVPIGDGLGIARVKCSEDT
ncbi:MAG: class I SAM-dependent methyltransferase [Phycisphaerales bacterium]|nr:class I SAM-dependent methyltransferase [Phycisphaerales bacterium]